jgi:hypothetical protein
MTDMEKKMNKEVLVAYKNMDTTQYAMVPGLNATNI